MTECPLRGPRPEEARLHSWTHVAAGQVVTGASGEKVKVKIVHTVLC